MKIPTRPQASFGRPRKSKQVAKVMTKVKHQSLVKNINARSRKLRRSV